MWKSVVMTSRSPTTDPQLHRNWTPCGLPIKILTTHEGAHPSACDFRRSTFRLPPTYPRQSPPTTCIDNTLAYVRFATSPCLLRTLVYVQLTKARFCHSTGRVRVLAASLRWTKRVVGHTGFLVRTVEYSPHHIDSPIPRSLKTDQTRFLSWSPKFLGGAGYKV